jgi:hypothetical protein
MKNNNNHNKDNMNNNINKHQKSMICIYTNKDKNEFAIGLKDDEHFRAMTKACEFYTRFVDVFEQVLNDENEVDWKQASFLWDCIFIHSKYCVTCHHCICEIEEDQIYIQKGNKKYAVAWDKEYSDMNRNIPIENFLIICCCSLV